MGIWDAETVAAADPTISREKGTRRSTTISGIQTTWGSQIDILGGVVHYLPDSDPAARLEQYGHTDNKMTNSAATWCMGGRTVSNDCWGKTSIMQEIYHLFIEGGLGGTEGRYIYQTDIVRKILDRGLMVNGTWEGKCIPNTRPILQNWVVISQGD